jgi:CMD domain protein
MTATADIIDRLAGIAPGSALDAVRARRPDTRTWAQRSHDALFAPADPGDVSSVERAAVAVFVAGLHGDGALAALHAADLVRHGAPADLVAAIDVEVTRARAPGPFGRYPEGPLAAESVDGPSWRIDDARRAILGRRLAAGLEHARFLVLHPRDAGPSRLQALLAAGWSPDGVVTLSQTVAFLAFQIRAAHGLRVLAGHA